MAPLQKRALSSLAIGVVLAAALIAVFLIKGDINALDTDEGFRYIVYAVLIGVPLIYLILVNLTLRKPTQVDERDRLIMERAPKVQLISIYFTLAAWIIILTEVYRETGQIPDVFLTVIFISVLIISTLAQSLGILIGYWRMNRNA
jgi:L-asparagine transporter-like permease